MTHTPRLSIGLPVYNGERYLAEAVESLLAQTYQNFELIISDNASSDGTEGICRRYVAHDPRVIFIRQPRNLGCVPNHNFVLGQARGELFKWASHDDIYAPKLLQRCVEALDTHPEAVLSHTGTSIIDNAGNRVRDIEYLLATDSPHAPERFHSVLFGTGGDDFYGVIRTEVLRLAKPHASYHHAERTLMAEIGLHGTFCVLPEQLYFRRDHVARAERANPTKRGRSINMDPRRANPWLHPTVRLLAEYVWGFAGAVRRAPISAQDRRQCYAHLARWLASRAGSGLASRTSTNKTGSADAPLVVAEASRTADGG